MLTENNRNHDFQVCCEIDRNEIVTMSQTILSANNSEEAISKFEVLIKATVLKQYPGKMKIKWCRRINSASDIKLCT